MLSKNEIFEKTTPKYLGDEYLTMFDILEDGTPLENMYQRMALQLNINTKLFAFMNGTSREFVKQLAFHKGVNKVYKSDPEKYKKIWLGNDPKYPYKRVIPLEFDGQDIKTTQEKNLDHIYT